MLEGSARKELIDIAQSARIFAKDELRQRIADGAIGVFWIFLAPLLQLAVFYFVFVELFQARSAGVHNYLVFLSIGFWPWLAFSETVVRCTPLLVEKAGIAGKVRISRIGMFTGVAFTSFSFHVAGFVLVLLVLSCWGEVTISTNWLLLPILWAALFAFSFSIAIIFSLLNVFIRDTARIVGLFLTLWFFTTPIFYPASSLPSFSSNLQAYNPLGVIISMNRELVQGERVSNLSSPSIILICSAFALAVFLYRRVRFELEEFS